MVGQFRTGQNIGQHPHHNSGFISSLVVSSVYSRLPPLCIKHTFLAACLKFLLVAFTGILRCTDELIR